MRILITGAMGFAGRHLIEHLREKGDCLIFGADLAAAPQPDHYDCDLTDYEAVLNLIENTRPDQIYHLAGTFSNDYAIDYASNVLTTKTLFDALLTSKYDCRILLIGSAAEYGLIGEGDNPVRETQALNPVSVYGLTKVYQTYLMKFYCQLKEMNVVMARPFNLRGRGMSERLFIGRVYKQIADYKEGKIDKIKVGNLNARRDYIDVIHAMGYYELIMNSGKTGEIYNVGTGQSVLMLDLLKSILVENNLDMSIVERDQYSSCNKMDVPDVYADITKLLGLL